MHSLAFVVNTGDGGLGVGQTAVANALLRVGLASVTLVAAVGKLADMTGTRQAMADFGVPARMVGWSSLALPLTELALALTLLIDPVSQLAGLGLSLLMLAFSLGLINLLRQDKRPPCHCFGAVHSAPVGKDTVLRALLLALLAGISARLPVFPLSRHPFKVGLGMLLVLGGTGAAIRRRKRLGADAARLLVGQRLPALRLASRHWLEDLLRSSDRTVLLLLSAQCGPCKLLEASLAEWKQTLSGRLNLLPVYLEGADAEHVLESRQFKLLKSPTPGAMLVDRRGFLLHPQVSGADEIEALIRISLSQPFSEPA